MKAVHRIFSAVALAVAAIPAIAVAQAIPPTVPASMPNMQPMHFLMGTWNCRMPGGTASLKFTSTMDGMWMLGEGSSALSSTAGTHMAQIYMTYDSASSKWVWMNAQSGGGYGLLYSPGWQGNTMRWQGDTAGKPGSMTMTRSGETTLRITQSAADATGYQRMQTYTCEKAG